MVWKRNQNRTSKDPLLETVFMFDLLLTLRLQREWEDLEQQKLENETKDTKTQNEKEFNSTADLWKKGKG